MKAAKTTQPAAVKALSPRTPSPFGSRPFHATLDDPVQENQRELKKENRTGLPDNLKAGIENLSGVSLDDVKVHFSSSKPSKLHALAYAQGSTIHIGPGQEKHLPHEAWHVVQQKQGRVRSTLREKGVSINDDVRLEHEADVNGAKSEQTLSTSRQFTQLIRQSAVPTSAIQRKAMATVKDELRTGLYAANFDGNSQFISKHIGLTGTNDNLSAAMVHSQRINKPATNTVIADAKAFKTSLANGVWGGANEGKSWAATTAAAVALKSTTKKNAAIIDAPNLQPTPLQADQADDFTVAGGKIAAVAGVSDEELDTAVKTAGSYPKNGASNKKRDYRQKLITSIKAQRATTHHDQTIEWVKANFSRINDTPLTPANTGSIEQIKAIPGLNAQVTAWIYIDTGDIHHLVGYE